MGDRAERALEASIAARRQGDARTAAGHAGSAFAAFQDAGDRVGMARALVEVGLVALAGGDPEAAGRSIAEALVVAREADDGPTLAAGCRAAAALAEAVGDPETATRLARLSDSQPPAAGTIELALARCSA
jgi:non-specific serine/threonine protein kinase